MTDVFGLIYQPVPSFEIARQNQVQDVNLITPGKKLIMHFNNGKTAKIEVLANPFQVGKSWWVKVKIYISDKKSSEYEISLADHAVCCYADGSWNPYNWLESED